jgi:hypothetical protein
MKKVIIFCLIAFILSISVEGLGSKRGKCVEWKTKTFCKKYLNVKYCKKYTFKPICKKLKIWRVCKHFKKYKKCTKFKKINKCKTIKKCKKDGNGECCKFKKIKVPTNQFKCKKYLYAKKCYKKFTLKTITKGNCQITKPVYSIKCLKVRFCAKNCRIFEKKRICIAKHKNIQKCHKIKTKECNIFNKFKGERYKRWKVCDQYKKMKKCARIKKIKFCKRYHKKRICKRFYKKKFCIRRKKCCGICKAVPYAWETN